MITLLAPLLMAGPLLAGPAPLEPPTEPPRQAGIYVDAGFGLAHSSAPSELPTGSFTGAAVRTSMGFTFLLGKRLRLGPMMGTGASFAGVTLEDGSEVSSGAYQLSIAPHLEYEITRVWSVAGSVGPAWLSIGRETYLGPEMSVVFTERQHFAKTNRKVGFAYRFVYVPTFALDAPVSGPGHLFLFTIGVAAGMP
jgi:hypothetical protein